MRAAYWEYPQVETSIVRMECNIWMSYYLQLVDTLKYSLKDIFICIIKEQCSDKGESTWRGQKGWQNIINDIVCHKTWLQIADTPMAKCASTEPEWLLVV
jgi:hypothetical protein